MRIAQSMVLGGVVLQDGLLGSWAPHMVAQGVPCMAMVLLGRLARWALDTVLHLVPSEACRQVLPVAQADLVAWLVLQTVLLGAECVAAGLNAAAAAAAAAVGVMVSA